jgi:phosphate transport system permease protein
MTLLPTPAEAGAAAGVRTGAPMPRRSAAGASAATRARRTAAFGQAMTWLCGGALALNLLLMIGMMALLGYHGLAYFWQRDLHQLRLRDGRQLLGEIWEVEKKPATSAQAGGEAARAAIDRLRIKIGNRDVGGLDFEWVDGKDVAGDTRPAGAVMLERTEWGNFYGTLSELKHGDQVLAQGPAATWRALQPLLEEKRRQREAIGELENGEIGEVNYGIEQLRLEERKLELRTKSPEELARGRATIAAKVAEQQKRFDTLNGELAKRRERFTAETLVMSTAGGETREMPVANVLRAIHPNAMGRGAKLRLYLSRAWEFVSADPRESNTEGGIFPAIFGTVMMVFLMTVAVAPLGVLAALYLREYARQGLLVRLVRIAVNNLAGVPSIVFGVFGLGFFVYLVGGSIDRIFFPESLPTPTFGTGGILWAALTLALLTVPVVIVAAEEGMAAVPGIMREGARALGATKFETVSRVVVPAAAPGILTGLILAMARAAGEVAPLMIVGMVKLAPTLPMDGHAPFLHLDRKFMHLGFHIFDVGFQSPNVEATTPLVFAAALLLILVVTVMNVVAITLRNHLRRKYAGSAI